MKTEVLVNVKNYYIRQQTQALTVSMLDGSAAFPRYLAIKGRFSGVKIYR